MNLDYRQAALATLTRVLSDGVFLDDALVRVEAPLRGWVHEAVAGTLRWKGRVDWVIDQLAFKKKPTGAIRKVLEIAVYQLLNQPQIQPAWIVSESVALVKKREGEAASRFVNAILRKVADSDWRSIPFPEGAGIEEQARWASLPAWLWKRVVRERGLDWARAYAEAGLTRPVTWVRARSQPERAERGPLSDSYRLLEWWPVHQSPAYDAGELFVQDISSQRLLHEFSEHAKKHGVDPSQSRVLDLCAAPGGKSTGLAWDGWTVLATDRDPQSSRFEMLRETAKRTRSTHAIQVVEKGTLKGLGPLDSAWVDAPCTGTGLLRRHPEVRWLKDEKALAELQSQQRLLIEEAAALVRSGGLLMLTVCSILREELHAPAKGFKLIHEWVLAPQDPPEGDGFGALLFLKDGS